MDSYLSTCKSAFKAIAGFSILLSTLIFASPATAAVAAREANATVNKVAPTQVAYYGYHRYHRYNHYRWHRGYHYNRYHRWHHWRRW